MPSVEKTIHLLYSGKVKVIFDPTKRPRYTVRIGRKKLKPLSVSEIANTADKSFVLMPWAKKVTRRYFTDAMILLGENPTRDIVLRIFEEAMDLPEKEKKEAGDTGNAVHEFLHQFARAKIDRTEAPALPDDRKVRKCIKGFLAWYKAHKVVFVEAERVVYSLEHGYVGTLDVVARVDGVLTLLDYKTAEHVYPSFLCQIAGYWSARQEEGMKIKQAILLHFDKNTGMHRPIVVKRLEKLWPAFESALKFRKEEKSLRKLLHKRS